MKHQYTSPQLKVYGSVSRVTEVFGASPTKDTFIFNGVPSDVDGSGSIVIEKP